MTITSEVSRVDLVGDGVNDTFTFTFEIYADTDVLVYVDDTLQTVNVDYTIAADSIENPDGGDVVFAVGSIPALDAVVSIILNLPYTQLIDYTEGDKFPAETHERGLDRLVKIVQSLKESIKHVAKLPASSLIDLIFPNPSPNDYIGWNAAADNLENKVPPVTVTATQYEVDALISYGGGTEYTKATLDATHTAVGTVNPVTILLRPGSWNIDADADYSAYSNVSYKMPNGSLFDIDALMTLTIHSPENIDAGKRQQIFSGTGKVAFSVGGTVYPEWWGENTTPGTTNMSTQTDAAITAVSANGGTVYFQPQTYIIADVTLKSHVNLKGSGWNTLIKKKSDATYIFTCDSGSADVSNNIHDITISDMQIEGLSVDVAFSEHHHAININGVNNIVIERCKITEFEGDGIYLGSSNVAATERHNERVIIRDCYFDGVNKENRQGISIIDGTHITIENNYFTRIAKATMPGAIDMEPNADAFARIRHIKIVGNEFYDIGGNVAAIAYYIPLVQASLTTPSHHIIIENNQMDTAGPCSIAFNQAGVPTTSSQPNVIRVANNEIRNSTRPFSIKGIKDAVFSGDIYQAVDYAALLGYSGADDDNRDITLQNETFRQVGIDNTSGGVGLSVFTVDNLTISGCTFNDCGKANGTSGYGIDFNTGTSSSVTLLNNVFLTPAAYTTRSIVKEAAHTFTPSTNYFNGNDLGGIATTDMSGFDIVSFTDGDTTPSVKSRERGAKLFVCANTTGPTTITLFHDGYVGQIISVRIDANTTVQNNANMLLAGGANFTGNAEDIITLVCIGADSWREISRSVN